MHYYLILTEYYLFIVTQLQPPSSPHTHTLQKWENVLLREVISLEGEHLLVICCESNYHMITTTTVTGIIVQGTQKSRACVIT